MQDILIFFKILDNQQPNSDNGQFVFLFISGGSLQLLVKTAFSTRKLRGGDVSDGKVHAVKIEFDLSKVCKINVLSSVFIILYINIYCAHSL